MSDAVSTTGILLKRRPATLPATVVVTSSSAANPTVITAAAPHGILPGETVVIAGHTGSTPSINGSYTPTIIDTTHFSIPVAVTVAGTGGTVQRDLVAIGELRSLGGVGFSRNEIDTSTHNEGRESKVLGLLRQPNITFQINYVGNNPTHVAIVDDIIGNYKRYWQVALPSGITYSAQAYVQQFKLGDSPVDAAQIADGALSWAEPIVPFVPA